MPVTSVFGDTDKFDPVIFDTRLNYTVAIEETATKFDPAVFGDTDQFDTIAGGVIAVSDTIVRLMASYRSPAAQSVSITDSVSRLQNIFRTITESTITISDSVSRLLEALRSISQATSVADAVAAARPTSSVTIYDLGFKFDSGIFGDDDQFDLAQSTYEITDTVTRQMDTFRNITGVSISISDSVSRLFAAFRTLSETTAITDSVSRLMNTFRSVSDATSIGDSISRLMNTFRTMSDSVSISDSVSRLITTFRSISESESITDSVSRLMASFRSITESTISISDAVSRVRAIFRTITEATLSVADVLTAIVHAPAMVIQNTVYILRTSRITTYIAKIIRNTVYG